ncbi:MAG: RdgB/HAM1 family non-canonical purine NTP pyrophosphatase [Candidatus Bathyarchaeota archaeon]|nr:RdgB/HAM1 family non-canonical purine NTP pyrophosphatase [Candidatus Bathyarchaeota archaeon]
MKGKVVFFATGNIHKFNEARVILTQNNIATAMLREKAMEIQSNSLVEIAVASAKDAYPRVNLPLIVEDAGLFIDALNGFPGPYAAYAYKTLGNDGILQLLQGTQNHKATFRSAIAYIDDTLTEPLCFEGEVTGEITQTQQASNPQTAFGFDPIFQPASTKQTFAQMTPQQKNQHSHRAKALQKFANWYKM